jgi:hypothetical protein
LACNCGGLRRGCGVLNRRADRVREVRIADHDYDAADRVAEAEEKLRFHQRHEDVGLIVLRHADFKCAGNPIGLDARRAAEGSHFSLGRDKGHTHGHAQPFGQPLADDDGVAFVVAVHGARRKFRGHGGERL